MIAYLIKTKTENVNKFYFNLAIYNNKILFIIIKLFKQIILSIIIYKLLKDILIYKLKNKFNIKRFKQ